jgi:ribosome-associated translation inhibitor RaiA
LNRQACKRRDNAMQFQFNSDSSVMGTDDVAERIEAQVREKLTRFEERLTRLEVHVHNEHHHTHGNDDKGCTIEARPRGGKPIGVTEHGSSVDAAARKAASTMAQRLTRLFGKEAKHRHEARPEKVM